MNHLILFLWRWGARRIRNRPWAAVLYPGLAPVVAATTAVLNAEPVCHLDILRGFFGLAHPDGKRMTTLLLLLGDGSPELGFRRALAARGPLSPRERVLIADPQCAHLPAIIDEDYAARYLGRQLFQFINTPA